MTVLEVQIPDDVELKITRLVDEGEFDSFDQAVREVLSAGITAYQVNPSHQEEEEAYGMGGAGNQYGDEYIF